MDRRAMYRPAAGVVLLGACAPALAAAPVYFDLGGLIVYSLAWLGAVLVLGIAALVSRSKDVRRVFGAILLLPVLLMVYAWGSKEFDTASEKRKAERLFDDYGRFCSQRGGGAPARAVAMAAGSSLFVSLAPEGPRNKVPDGMFVARLFLDHPALCRKTGVREVQYLIPAPGPEEGVTDRHIGASP